MRAMICVEPGVFEYREIAAPVPQPGYAILQLKRIGICGTDLHAFEGTQPYFTYPRILGHELSGTLVATGGAEGFAIGEAVTILPYLHCGKCIACKTGKTNCCSSIQVCGVHIDGAMSDLYAVPTYTLIKGAGLGFDELALVEPLAIGAHAVRRAAVQKDEFVLVIGAGPIGIGTMDFAGIAGATVIAMDRNEDRLQFCMQKNKAAFFINAAKDDIKERLMDITEGDMPTVVMDATGNLAAINNALQWLAHGGRMVLIGLQKEAFQFSHPEFHKRETTLMSSRNATRADFLQVIQAIQSGKINPSDYITHRTGFEDLQAVFPSWLNPANGVIKAMVTMD